MKKIPALYLCLFCCLQLTAQSTIFKRVWTAPYVLQSHEAGFSFQIEILDSLSPVDSLQVITDAGFLSQAGIDNGILTFLDDGLEDDLEANDRVYTASNLKMGFPINEDAIKVPMNLPFFVNEISTFSGGSKFTEQSDLIFVGRWFKPTVVPEVNQVNSNFQHTSYVVNIVDEDIDGAFTNDVQAFKRYYNHLPDDRHSMIQVYTEVFRWSTNSGSAGAISNDVEGIGVDIFDDSADYNSNSVLEQDIFIGKGFENTGVVLHELHHRWGISMPQEFHMSTGGHLNGLFEMNGGGGSGDNIEKIVSNGDSTYNIYYNPTTVTGAFGAIDMYLAGYGPLDDIKFPIKVIPNPTFVGTDTDGSIIYHSEKSLLYITKDFFVEKLGIRSPDYLNARREQRVGMMVRSQKLLTPAELAYFHEIMVELEKTESSMFNPSYYDQCMGAGRLITRITDDIVSVENEFFEQNKFKVFPNPSSTELNIEPLSKETFSIQSGQIINSIGKVVLNFNEATSIDIQNLNSGLYFLKLKTEEGTFVEQFVKTGF